MSLFPSVIIHGVHINKRILIMFVVVSYPFFTNEHTTDTYLVRGFIQEKHKSIQSQPYNRQTLCFYSPAVISPHLSRRWVTPCSHNTNCSGLNTEHIKHSKVATPFGSSGRVPSLSP